MKIAIGTAASESKIRAAQAVCGRAFPDAQVVAVPVTSAVSAQPVTDEETIRGALHRAREARRLGDADLGIGIEGGVHKDARGVWMCTWAAVVDRNGREGISSGVRFQLPSWMASRALSGEELGDVVDASLGHSNAHEELGAIGLLTHGLVDRQAALEQAVAAALIPFLVPARRQASP